MLLQEIFGVNEYIREVCDNYAEKLGSDCPSLFDRESQKIELNYDSDGVEQGALWKDSVDLFPRTILLLAAITL